MRLFEKRAYLSIMLAFGLLVLGCGKNPEADSALVITESAPQIKITLHSKLELDFSLEPAPQPQVSEAATNKFGEMDNKPIAGVYANLKNSATLQSQAGRKPSFKKDIEYQSIQRYEHMESYAITIEKSPKKSQIRKTVKVQDKPLIFAGRGYNVSAFARENKPAIDLDYATHLVSVHPEPTGNHLRERLDSEEGNSRNTKYLIYNSTRSAFGKLPPPLVESKPDLSRKAGPAIPLDKNADSVLLFPHGEKSMLVLRKGREQFDVLAGNESLNKKKFKASKVLETNKKIPNILQ